MATQQHKPEQRQKGRPSVEEAARIDQLILQAAREILIAHGESASLNAVAKSAGLSRKTVYARYANKEALFLAAARSALVGKSPITFVPAATFEAQLFNYLTEVFDLILSDAALAFQRALITNAHLLPELRDAIKDATLSMIFQPLLALIQQAATKGDIAVDDTELAARIIFDTVVGQMTAQAERTRSGHQPDDLDRYARQLASMMCRGLQSGATRAPD